jgi:hypothetical protein
MYSIYDGAVIIPFIAPFLQLSSQPRHPNLAFHARETPQVDGQDEKTQTAPMINASLRGISSLNNACNEKTYRKQQSENHGPAQGRFFVLFDGFQHFRGIGHTGPAHQGALLLMHLITLRFSITFA